jgi:hypothetical protein
MPDFRAFPYPECDHNSLPIVQTFATCATVGSEEAPNEKLAFVRHPVGSRARAPVRPGDPDPHHVSSALHVERNVRIDLVVCGCMPGNMNTVRKSSWYDLITKGQFRAHARGAGDAGRQDRTLFAAGGCRGRHGSRGVDGRGVGCAAGVAACAGCARRVRRQPAASVRPRR